MSGSNTFGTLFRQTSFGESHGTAMGVVIDGCPAGVKLNIEKIQTDLDRRRPGQVDVQSGKIIVTNRNEEDQVQILSGLYDGKTLGTPIACIVQNQDHQSQDYDKVKNQPRIGHADDTWKAKFGHSDHRGGGRSSARETVTRVIAGSVASQFLTLKYPDIKVTAFVKSIGPYSLSTDELNAVDKAVGKNTFSADSYVARFPQAGVKIEDVLTDAKQSGESYGGIIEVWIDGAPKNLGEPVFGKLKNQLASAMMSIGATSGFELGDGFAMASKKGTEVHTSASSKVYGGIRGGISTGERIVFRVAFKPTSSIKDVAQAGRHDPCIVPRAVPVVEAMAWAVLADCELMARSNQI